MSRLPSLTRDQLRAVYAVNPTPAVKRLLWEIHRLRAVALRANHLVGALEYYRVKLDHPQAGLAVTNLREALKDEPVVKEEEARRLAR